MPVRPAPWNAAGAGRCRPAVSSLLALVVLLTVTGFGLVSWQLVEKEQARQQAETRRREADTERGKAIAARNESQELSAGMRLDKGIELVERGEVAAGLHWMLEALRTAPEGADNLRRIARLEIATWLDQTPALRQILPLPRTAERVVLHPDGRRLAVSCSGFPEGCSSVCWLDVSSPGTIGPIMKHPAKVHSLAIRVDRRHAPYRNRW